MTAKRFCISSDSNQNIYDTEEKCYYSSIDAMKLCDLLNELDAKYIDEYALRETLQQELQRVEEENKQLRQQINELQFNKTIGQQEYQRRVFYE